MQRAPGQNDRWAERLVEFYEGVLRTGEVLPSEGGLGEGMRQPSISADVYANILTGALQQFTPDVHLNNNNCLCILSSVMEVHH